MAITQNDLDISNISYTNKDFEAVYTELLDLAKKLSYKFDPTSSNESDPFIVLLKLAAFVTDKVNYNVDKNILERFITSATQEKSMAELTSRLGYNMHYYEAATTSVIFRYIGELTDITGDAIRIGKYSIISNDTSDLDYVTLEDAELFRQSEDGLRQSSTKDILVMQGTLHDLDILGDTTIKKENLDEDRCLYFPETKVAQNGVFITGGSEALNIESQGDEEWYYSENLNAEIYGSKVYTFGYDSYRRLPYIKFPEWINLIIGDGIQVKYLTTDGIQGNVKAKALNRVSSFNPDIASEYKQNIVVNNVNASTNGKDPETIDEAYNGFKKTIGTFDTLVTCRDYANAIYKMLDNSQNPLVSNVQVSDRRNDINYTYNVVTFGPYGETVETDADADDMSAFNLCLYPLTPVREATFSQGLLNQTSINDSAYNTSFVPLSSIQAIVYQLEDVGGEGLNSRATLSHDYKQVKQGIYAIKNMYALDALITTYTKVNGLEEASILENVNNALARDYNARKVDFGYAIPYDKLVETIENADERIKSVALRYPEVTPYVLDPDGNTEAMQDKSDYNNYRALVYKNILAGKISLFDYNEDFQVNYGDKNPDFRGNVSRFTSNSNIGSISTSEKQLKANEVIQFAAPKFNAKRSYPYGINYTWNGSTVDKGQEYQIKGSEELTLEWTDENDQNVGRKLTASTVIKPNFTLQPTSGPDTKKKTYTDLDNGTTGNEIIGYSTLQVKDEIVQLAPSEQVLTTPCKCTWYVNDRENRIFWTEEGNTWYYILQDGEYFFYSDFNLSSLFSFGSGTKIVLDVAPNNYQSNPEDPEKGFYWICKKVDRLSDFTDEGVEILNEYFVTMLLTSEQTITITEQEIFTLSEGCYVKASVSTTVPDNTFGEIIPSSTVISYKIEGPDFIPLTTKPDGYGWRVRALLDLNAGPNLIQQLVGGQRITFIPVEFINGSWVEDPDNPIEIDAGQNIKLSTITQKPGGEDVSLEKLDWTFIEDPNNINYPKLYIFEPSTDNATSQRMMSLDRSDSNYINVNVPADDEFTIALPQSIDAWLMIYVDEGSSGSLTFSGVDFITGAGEAGGGKLNAGVHICKVDGNELKVSNKHNPDAHMFTMSKLRVINGINPALDLQSDLDSVIADMKTQLRDHLAKCNLLNFIDNSRAIETSGGRKLSDPEAFWDYNNIANRFTIPQIDFANSKITLANNCKK